MKTDQKASVVVCVERSASFERLTHVAKAVAERTGCAVKVVNIQPSMSDGEADYDELERLHQMAMQNGVELTVFFSDTPAVKAAQYVKRNNAVQVITGMPNMDNFGFVDRFRELLPNITISMVSGEGITYNIYPQYLNTVSLART